MRTNSDNKKTKTTNLENAKEFIDTNFRLNESIDPIEFVNKVIENVKEGKMKANELLLAKKSQYEASREIYEQNLAGKVCTSIVQKIFKRFCKMEQREMVVESQKDKISLIRESTKILMKKRSPDELIVYHNGDMSSWSGRDIYDKFIVLINSMATLGIIGPVIHSLLSACLLATRKSKIYIGKDIDNLDPDLKSKFKIDPENNQHYITYEFSWAQGLFHNISSFVHSLEQRFRQKFFTAYIKRKYNYTIDPSNWFQVVHSDDKNEVILIPKHLVKEFVKFNTLMPRLFALEASNTKDSFSFLCSEMVGVQNFNGSILDNSVKTISQIFSKCENKSVIDNYKYLVSRATAYFLKSNDLFGAQFIESLNYKRLKKISLIKPSLKLPVNFGGRYQRDLTSLIKYGNFSDYLCKSYFNRSNFSKFVELVSKNKVYYRKYIPFNLMTMINKFRNDGLSLDQEYLDLDITTFAYQFSYLINTSLITSKRDMIISLDNLKFVRFMRYVKTSKYSMKSAIQELNMAMFFSKFDPLQEKDKSWQEKQNKRLFFKKFNIKKTETLEEKPELNLEDIQSIINKVQAILTDIKSLEHSPFIIDQKIFLDPRNVSSFRREVNNKYKLNRFEEVMNPWDTKGRTSYELDSNFSLTTGIDLKLMDGLMKKDFDKVFNSYKNRINYKKIIKSFNKIINLYDITSIEDYVKKRVLISEYLDTSRMSSPLIYTSSRDTKKFHNSIRNTLIEGEEFPMSDVYRDVEFSYFKDYSITKSDNPLVILDQIKCVLNNYIQDGSFNILNSLEDIIKNMNCPLSKLRLICDDINLYLLIENIRRLRKTLNIVKKINLRDTDVKFESFYKSSEYNINLPDLKVYFIKQRNRIVGLFICFKERSYFTNVSKRKSETMTQLMISNIFGSFFKRYPEINPLNHEVYSDIVSNYNLVSELQNRGCFLECDEQNYFFLTNVLSVFKKTVEFTWISQKEVYFRTVIAESTIKRKLTPFKDATNYDPSQYVSDNMIYDYNNSIISLIRDTETTKYESSFPELILDNIKVEEKDMNTISLYKKILMSSMFDISKTEPLEKFTNKSIEFTNSSTNYREVNDISQFYFVWDENSMIYRRNSTMIVFSDTLIQAESMFKILYNNYSPDDVSDNFKVNISFKSEDQIIRVIADCTRLRQGCFFVSKSSLTNNLFKDIELLKSKITVESYSDITFVSNQDVLGLRKRISQIQITIDQFSAFDNKIRKLMMMNIIPNIEKYRLKVKRKNIIRGKFRKFNNIYENDIEFLEEFPNLIKYSINYSKYSVNELFLRSLYLSLLFKFMYKKTKDYYFKRMSIQLTLMIKHLRISRSGMMNMLINDTTMSMLYEEIQEIFKNDSITTISEILSLYRTLVYKYTEEKKGLNQEKTILDIIKEISEVNKEDKRTFKIRKRILKLIHLSSESIKFLVYIGFDQGSLDNYKNSLIV